MTEITFRSDMQVDYVQHMGSDEMVARAARVSTGSDLIENDKIKGLIRYLARESHTSPFEHVVLTLRIEAPIFIAREVMRHRVFSFNEVSGRYSKLKPEFYAPPEGRPLVNAGSGAHPELVASQDPSTERDTRAYTRAAYASTWRAYEGMVSGSGVAHEVARNVLPVGVYTTWYMTGNLHAWFKFLELRDGGKGHPIEEIQWLSRKVHVEVKRLFPISHEAWMSR